MSIEEVPNLVLDLSKLAIGDGRIAVGWDDVEELNNEQNIGNFLKLQDQEVVFFVFLRDAPPLAYFAHRVPKLDENGMPIREANGKFANKLRTCAAIYHDAAGLCKDCDEQYAQNLRTASLVAVVKRGQDGKTFELVTVTTLENGPKFWKGRVFPVLKEWSSERFNRIFTMKRLGSGLQTDYSFGASQSAVGPLLAAKIAAAERPNLLDILALNEQEDAA